jgi:hypothetical protein
MKKKWLKIFFEIINGKIWLEQGKEEGLKPHCKNIKNK